MYKKLSSKYNSTYTAIYNDKSHDMMRRNCTVQSYIVVSIVPIKHVYSQPANPLDTIRTEIYSPVLLAPTIWHPLWVVRESTIVVHQ